jgi:hypothetical protein
MIGSLVAAVATRRRAELGDLYADGARASQPRPVATQNEKLCTLGIGDGA